MGIQCVDKIVSGRRADAAVGRVRIDVDKDPVTDRGKQSKKGRLAVIEPTPGTYQTIPEAELGSRKNILETVYRNGKLIRDFSFDEVRENASR